MIRKLLFASLVLASAAYAAPPPPTPPPASGATVAAPVATQSGRVARTTDLRDKPANDGAMLRVVPADTVVEVAERQGGWYRVSVEGVAGWMRLSAVRFGAPGAVGKASGGASPLSFLQSGRSAVTTGSVTTGVRGLSEEGLQRAEPNHAAVAALDALAVSSEDARRYAAEMPVAAVTVGYVKAPEKRDEKKSKRKSKSGGD